MTMAGVRNWRADPDACGSLVKGDDQWRPDRATAGEESVSDDLARIAVDDEASGTPYIQSSGGSSVGLPL